MSLQQYYRAFTLRRQVPTGGAMDEPEYETVGLYRGFIQPVSGSEVLRFGKIDENYTHRLYTAVDTPVIYGDRIEQDGTTWRAVFTEQPKGITGMNRHKEVLLEYV